MEIGEINYQRDEEEPNDKVYEIDIIIADNINTGLGFGTQALTLLTHHLNKKLGIRKFTLYTLPYNNRAIRSFIKSGFQILDEHRDKNGIFWTRLRMDLN
jgi:RimJ/RimL family protein N-acetyltransferase